MIPPSVTIQGLHKPVVCLGNEGMEVVSMVILSEKKWSNHSQTAMHEEQESDQLGRPAHNASTAATELRQAN